MDFFQLAKQWGTTESYPKKAFIFQQGEKDPNIYLIQSGVVKAHYSDREGKEFIKSFLFAGDVIGSMDALNGGQCSFHLSCLHEASVIKVPYSKIVEQARSDLTLANAVIELLLAFGRKKERREFELLTLSAEQRYLALLEKYPQVTELITQNDMARYLGITPVALSRIKHDKG